jgi:acetyltransferase
MKVIGPIHKSDVGGVVLNIEKEDILENFEKMIKIKDTTSILIQPMISGIELFVGGKYEENFGHMVLAGLGGIFIEVFKDISKFLGVVHKSTAKKMINSLKSVAILNGTRGKKGINKDKFEDVIVKLSLLLMYAPEIIELDINPLLANEFDVIAVDARIRIEK